MSDQGEESLNSNEAASSPPAELGDSQSAGDAPSVWSGFYKKTIRTRQDQLRLVFPRLPTNTALPNNIADNMIENCIGTISLPLGLGLNFLINGKNHVIPMAIEEPSVVAAVSGAAKTVADNGGFETTYTGNVMVSQIQLLDIDNVEKARDKILAHKKDLMTEGDRFCRTMKRRGGGMRDIEPRIVPFDKQKYFKVHVTDPKTRVEGPSEFLGENSNTQSHMLIVHVHVDVCESMGANAVNTVAEGLAPTLVNLVGGRAHLKIVTNFCTERRATAEFRIPLSKLGYKKFSGQQIAQGLLEGYALACEDSYRAVTHNKGIMNGVDAAAIALGQDFRAIEAGAHAWACRTGKYQPLTRYRLTKKDNEVALEGFIELPVPIGVRGGAIQSHPAMEYTHGLLSNPNCADLGEVLASIGLAQNFAALRALVSEGIQRGHMSLHSRNIAIQAGAPAELVPEVSSYMIAQGKISVATAQDYLNSHMILSSGTKHRYKRRDVPPSTLFVELELEEFTFSINVVFESVGEEEVHLMIKEGTVGLPIQRLLFGERKGVEWFKQIFLLLQNLGIANKAPKRNTMVLSYKLKLYTMLMNLLIYRLIKLHPIETVQFVENILSAVLNPLSLAQQKKEVETIRVGFPLLYALWNTFKNQVDQSINVRPLADALKEEQLRIFHYCMKYLHVGKSENLEEFMRVYARRWQVTMFLLCDLHLVRPNLITAEALHAMFLLGHYLEWEGTVGNDIGKWKIDLETGEQNCFLFWTRVNKKSPSESSLEEFLKEVEKRNKTIVDKLKSEANALSFFDITVFLGSSIPLVQRYYTLAELMKSAKL